MSLLIAREREREKETLDSQETTADTREAEAAVDYEAEQEETREAGVTATARRVNHPHPEYKIDTCLHGSLKLMTAVAEWLHVCLCAGQLRYGQRK